MCCVLWDNVYLVYVALIRKLTFFLLIIEIYLEFCYFFDPSFHPFFGKKCPLQKCIKSKYSVALFIGVCIMMFIIVLQINLKTRNNWNIQSMLPQKWLYTFLSINMYLWIYKWIFIIIKLKSFGKCTIPFFNDKVLGMIVSKW